MIKRHIKENGRPTSGPKARIGRLLMAAALLLSGFVFTPGVVWSQSITIAGDADQGGMGRWMRAKVEEFSKQTGINVRYIGRPLSTTETLMLWQQDWAAQTPDVDVLSWFSVKWKIGAVSLATRSNSIG